VPTHQKERRLKKITLVFIAIAGAILFLLVDHSGPWIIPQHLTLRVVAGNDQPLAGATIRVTQNTWSIPCISLMGSSSASCGSGEWTVFDGRLDHNGEATVVVFQAAGLRADAYIACINGKEYEGYGAFTDWPDETKVKVVTLDYKRLAKTGDTCVAARGERLAAPTWWDDFMRADADPDAQDDDKRQ
jgi:hypothetical protein